MHTKIATCCYCGAREALVLDVGRHELTCGACGAPLHEMKSLPCQKLPSEPRPQIKSPVSASVQPRGNKTKKPSKRRGKKSHFSKYSDRKMPRKLVSKKLIGKIWDAIEDVFD